MVGRAGRCAKIENGRPDEVAQSVRVQHSLGFLMQEGLIQRTPRGRMLAKQGWSYLGLEAPRVAVEQLDMLGSIAAGREND